MREAIPPRNKGLTEPTAPLLVLAPMAGITDWPFRLLCQRMGARWVFTEMISAMGCVTAPSGLNVYRFLTRVHPEERTVIAQIFGHEPRYMQEAARRLEGLGVFSGIDINMGCPARKVTGSGSGCALMKDLSLAARIMAAVRKAVSLPVSVKLRLGWDAESLNAAALIRAAAEEGLDRATLHGRTGTQQYAGQADWPAMAAVIRESPIPVLANGDVFSARDAVQLLKTTGAEGVMVGRGALGNPWIFREISALFRGEGEKPPDVREILDTALWQAEQMAAWKGEERAAVEMRKHFAWYLKGLRGAAEARRRINESSSLAQVRKTLEDFLIRTVELV